MRLTITLERGGSGQWVASAIIGGSLWHKQYYGYSKREAMAEARADAEAEDAKIIREVPATGLDAAHPCAQCKRDMGYEFLLGPVCGKCCRANHRKCCRR